MPTQELLLLSVPSDSGSSASEDEYLQEAYDTEPVPPRKGELREVMKKLSAALKKPASSMSSTSKKVQSSIATLSSPKMKNFLFDSEAFGKCKAEFYSHKSYIRTWCNSTKKWTLVIQAEGHEHASKIKKLVAHVKKTGATKPQLLEIRANL